MTVQSPSLYALVPVDDTLEVEGSVVYDAMSGASPLFFNTLSGASGLGVTDYRTAGDVKVTKYFDGWAVCVGGVASSEQDYLSRGGAVDVRIFSDDRNRTYAFGFAGASDRINPTNGARVERAAQHASSSWSASRRRCRPTSIVKSNLTYSHGHGYYSTIRTRRSTSGRPSATSSRGSPATTSTLPSHDATLRLSYRLLHDSFGSVSNTFDGGVGAAAARRD